MTEGDFERQIGKEVKKKNGLFLKWVSPGTDGVPDRICLFPGGRIIFLELKRPGRKDGLSKRQDCFLRILQKYGFQAYKINSLEEFNQIFEGVQE